MIMPKPCDHARALVIMTLAPVILLGLAGAARARLRPPVPGWRGINRSAAAYPGT